MQEKFLGPVVTLVALVFLLSLHFAGVFTLPFLPSLQQLTGAQPPAASDQPQWWYKCTDGTWIADLSNCPGGAQEQLLNKPLEEYALTLDDVGAEFRIDESIPGYHEYTDEDKYKANIEELYDTGFYKGDAYPYTYFTVHVVHTIVKFKNLDVASDFLMDKCSIADSSAEFSSFPAQKGDESCGYLFIDASLIQPPVIHTIAFRTKNLFHAVILIDQPDDSNISTDYTSSLVDKIVEKTK